MQIHELAIKVLFEACSDADCLVQLAETVGLDPGLDFQEADLRGLSVAGEDLTNFNFRGADLRESDLRCARLTRSALEGATLDGALLEGIVWVGPATVDRHIFSWGEAWSEVVGDTLKNWVSQNKPADGEFGMNRETTRGFQRSLPFFENVKLLAFLDQNWTDQKLVIYFLLDHENLIRLDGTSPALHEINAKAPIHLNDDNVLEYIRFFCFMVRGENGPFYVLEELNESVLSDEIDDATRSLIEGTARPATLEGLNEHRHFLVDAVVFYSNAIFIANFAVLPTGMVEMQDDEPIAADLSVSLHLPIAESIF